MSIWQVAGCSKFHCSLPQLSWACKAKFSNLIDPLQ